MSRVLGRQHARRDLLRNQSPIPIDPNPALEAMIGGRINVALIRAAGVPSQSGRADQRPVDRDQDTDTRRKARRPVGTTLRRQMRLRPTIAW